MNLEELIYNVRVNTFDLDGNIFEDKVIVSFINEGIDRCKHIINELSDMEYLKENTDEPILLPSKYHHLLGLYSSSRCFFSDERYHQATTVMNEFEYKLEQFLFKLTNGEEEIVDDWGDKVDGSNVHDYVVDNYFVDKNGRFGDSGDEVV